MVRNLHVHFRPIFQAESIGKFLHHQLPNLAAGLSFSPQYLIHYPRLSSESGALPRVGTLQCSPRATVSNNFTLAVYTNYYLVAFVSPTVRLQHTHHPSILLSILRSDLTCHPLRLGSREQNYRPKDCGICQAFLTIRPGKGFWEGGLGTWSYLYVCQDTPYCWRRHLNACEPCGTAGRLLHVGSFAPRQLTPSAPCIMRRLPRVRRFCSPFDYFLTPDWQAPIADRAELLFLVSRRWIGTVLSHA
jgi:hypothetical protein